MKLAPTLANRIDIYSPRGRLDGLLAVICDRLRANNHFAITRAQLLEETGLSESELDYALTLGSECWSHHGSGDRGNVVYSFALTDIDE